ncbi:MAG TPA: hypothetical protein VL523_08810 [Terriglobia bacterium]|nr:hypothetical protein [Terriglobia bacterium]
MQGSLQRAREAASPKSVTPPAALFVLLALGLAVVLTGVGCGGGSSPQMQLPSGPGVSACVSGTVSSYLGTSCSQGSTVYHWLSYSCTSTPSSICNGLGANGANLSMSLDPQGPYTLLVGETDLWNVTAGQSVDVVISGTVYGATHNNNWPHFHGLPGQTGDGSEEDITTVNCSATGNCTNGLNGVSEDLCDSAHLGNCSDLSMIPVQIDATFKAAPAADPYTLTIEIKLNGGTSGSATLYSVGTHLIPLP